MRVYLFLFHALFISSSREIQTLTTKGAIMAKKVKKAKKTAKKTAKK